MSIELQVAQFAAYLALTGASVTVAIVSLTFAYRQNFGWSPLLLVTSHGLQGTGPEPKHYYATLDFEFWNRRKYPLVLRSVVVEFSSIKIKELPPEETISLDWHIHADTRMIYRISHTLESTEHKALRIAAPFASRTLDDLVDQITVRATYYDPRLDKSEDLVKKHVWSLR